MLGYRLLIMTKISNTSSAEHYKWGDDSDGWHLLKTAQLSVIEERMPVGAREGRHYHSNSQQFFYILEGEANLEVNGEMFTLLKGDGLHVEAGQPHQLMNKSVREIRFIVVSQPKSHGDRVDV